jgi:DNA-binding transcriptional LysR family regulator
MTFQQLKILLKILETGNFTKTGELLNVSQSGVSHTIASLESELGKKLLIRNKDKIELTEAGKSIIDHVREIVYQEELILQKLNLTKAAKKTIKLATFPSLTVWITKNIIPEIKEWNVDLSIKEGTYEDIENWIKNDDVDLGITTGPISPSYPFYHMFFDPLFLVVSKNHPLSIKENVYIEELQNQDFILPIAGCQQLIQHTFQKEHVDVHTIMELKETQTILDLIQENIGITILPRLALTPKDSLKYIPLLPQMKREVGITISKNHKSDLTIKRLFNLLVSRKIL